MLGAYPDQILFFGMILLEVVGSYVATMRLCRRPDRPPNSKFLIVPSILPSVFLLLSAWMLFGMGPITDLAAIAIAFSLLLTVVLLLAGWISTAIARKLHGCEPTP